LFEIFYKRKPNKTKYVENYVAFGFTFVTDRDESDRSVFSEWKSSLPTQVGS